MVTMDAKHLFVRGEDGELHEIPAIVGSDGFSPIVNMVREGENVILTITDKTGTHTETIHDPGMDFTYVELETKWNNDHYDIYDKNNVKQTYADIVALFNAPNTFVYCLASNIVHLPSFKEDGAFAFIGGYSYSGLWHMSRVIVNTENVVNYTDAQVVTSTDVYDYIYECLKPYATTEQLNEVSEQVDTLADGLVQQGERIGAVESGKVGFTDWARWDKGGVIKRGNYLSLDWVNNPYAETLTYPAYASAGSGSFIGKGTLENVLANYEKKGQLELIERIELKGLTSFTRIAEPDGTPYKFIDVAMKMCMVAGSGSPNIYMGFDNGSQAVLTYLPSVTSGAKYGLTRAYIQNGSFIGLNINNVNNYSSQGNVVATPDNLFRQNVNYINKIMYSNVGSPYPDGSYVEIYAVRA